MRYWTLPQLRIRGDGEIEVAGGAFNPQGRPWATNTETKRQRYFPHLQPLLGRKFVHIDIYDPACYRMIDIGNLNRTDRYWEGTWQEFRDGREKLKQHYRKMSAVVFWTSSC